MSKFTNTKNIPEYMFHAAESMNYRPKEGRMSVTHLTGAPLPRTLLMKHFDEIEQDVSDMFWALHGTSLDESLKKHSRWGLTNIKLEYLTLDGITLAGRPDYYGVLSHILADLKDTSVWNLKEARKEWIAQLNIYDWLLYTLVPQLKVEQLQVHAVGRDWRRGEKLRYGHDYPDIPFKILEIPRWPHKEQLDYIDAQLKDHKLNPERECTPEEKWQSKDTYAVKKEGRKSALKVEDSLPNAYTWCKKKGHVDGEKGISIEKRPGSCVKCEDYCNVNKYCPFWSK